VCACVAVELLGCGAATSPEIPSDAAIDAADVSSDAPTPPIDLTGRWAITLEGAIVPGQPRTYTGTLVLADSNGALSGVVDDWSNGAHSDFTGVRSAAHVRLDRLDRTPFVGFSAQFVGEAVPSGNAMAGTYQNDPTVDGGNAAAGAWSANRLR
jgi:hypothetical protein